MHVDAREPDGKPANEALRRALRLSADDRTDIGRCAAHVERQCVLDAREPRHPGGSDDARSRTGEKQRRGTRFVDRDETAGGGHHERAQVAEPVEVARDERAEVGVCRSRRGALVLAELWRNLA